MILREMARRHAPDMEAEPVLEKVYACTSAKIAKYNQPDISKRILSRAIAEIRLARHSTPSEPALEKKRIERDNQLSKCLSTFQDDGLLQIEKEIEALEKKCSAEKEGKANLEALIKRQAETKQRIYALASKVDRKGFAFYFYYQRPLLERLRKELERQLGVQLLDERFIESVVR